MAHEIRAIDAHTISQVNQLVQQDPVRHCFLAARIDQGGRGLIRPSYPDLLGYFDDGNLKSILMTGANIVPVKVAPTAKSTHASTRAAQHHTI